MPNHFFLCQPLNCVFNHPISPPPHFCIFFRPAADASPKGRRNAGSGRPGCWRTQCSTISVAADTPVSRINSVTSFRGFFSVLGLACWVVSHHRHRHFYLFSHQVFHRLILVELILEYFRLFAVGTQQKWRSTRTLVGRRTLVAGAVGVPIADYWASRGPGTSKPVDFFYDAILFPPFLALIFIPDPFWLHNKIFVS